MSSKRGPRDESRSESNGSAVDGCPLQAELERGCSPDRVPIPEDQPRELNMTHWEKLKFFIYKLSFERITDEQEQRLKVAWLGNKRHRTHEEFAAHHDASKEAQLPVDARTTPTLSRCLSVLETP